LQEETPENAEKKDENKEKSKAIKPEVKSVENKNVLKKNYYIQIAVFRNKGNAEEELKKFKEYNPLIEEYEVNNIKYYKLIIDNYISIMEAEESRNKIMQEKKLKDIPIIRVKIWEKNYAE